MNPISSAIALCLGGMALASCGKDLTTRSDTADSDTAYVADVFAGRTVPHFQILIGPQKVRDLFARGAGDRRHDSSVLATIREGGNVYTNVAIHLKGGAGSFRPFNDNPSLTLNFEKYTPGQTFHGLKKVSLNNSVQDPSYLNEKICRELFNAAGVPAPRAGFTTVQVNGRNLGVHVLTEGFNKQFLHHYFTNVHGNLYQTHGNQEITDKLDVNSGDNPANDAGLRALAQAVNEQDSGVRWRRLEQTLDMDRFIAFMAMEVMLCHWDGYCMNQNNYRVFHDLGSGRIVFIPHGMDQMFGTGIMRLGGRKSSANCPIFPPLSGAVADAVMRTPEGRRLYIARLGQLYTNVLRVDALLKRVDELSAVVHASLVKSGTQTAQDYQQNAEDLKAHIKARAESVARQLADATRPRDPRSLAPIHLTGWATRIQEGAPDFARTAEASRTNLLQISARHGKAAGLWVTRLRLGQGSYRFEGEVRFQGVESEKLGVGVGLRISGGRPRRELVGSADWQPCAYEFQVARDREVGFLCELRASSGEAWFDAEKLWVVPLE